ncbi:hypothetical protein [Streptomyces sp. Isolate_45]|uniref:hypothetical protein n=1 Tax=Streptomyces sp. Isolate_45 TaxID=2950111 RepID=UPI002481E392|nr:hypothetical protein [Streptomyces sp. Isolate_45]MDA5279879.1 hypothetical protein [Streptomyces sp. Isolate_45]
MGTPAGTPAPIEGEPVEESLKEAMQSAVMAVKLVMAIAGAVRRYQQSQNGVERKLPPPDEAVDEVKEETKKLFPSDLGVALMEDAEWPQMAQQLKALKDAGVDLELFLPRVGEIAVTVRDAVAANAARVAQDGTDEWEKLLRETMPAGPVREAILSSPTWPDIAAKMGSLDERGVDVREILESAHDEGLGVDQAVAKVLGAGTGPRASRDTLTAYGPLTTGLDVPRNLDLADRQRAMRQLSISPKEDDRFKRMVREALPGRENDAALLITARKWPLIAARMAKMEGEGIDLEPHLDKLTENTSWEKGSPSGLSSRLLGATSRALQSPLDGPSDSAGLVNSAAARAKSSGGPTKAPVAKAATPTTPAVAAHRTVGQPAKQGRSR